MDWLAAEMLSADAKKDLRMNEYLQANDMKIDPITLNHRGRMYASNESS